MNEWKLNYKVGKAELLEDSKILIIEDDYVWRLVIREIFRKLGFKKVEEAKNGRLGFEKAKKLNPNLIIMDIEMPEMNGIECCKKIRNDPNLSETAVLVQTALE